MDFILRVLIFVKMHFDRIKFCYGSIINNQKNAEKHRKNVQNRRKTKGDRRKFHVLIVKRMV